MPLVSPLFPSPAALCSAFPSAPAGTDANRTSKYPPAHQELYGTWSAVDDAKAKAAKLSEAATQEFEKASGKAQAKAGKIELFSAKYYAACTFGGLLACGLTHTAVTPLDLVKCRRQVDANLYKGNFEAWGKIARAEGLRGIFTGWSPTFFGYSVSILYTLHSGR